MYIKHIKPVINGITLFIVFIDCAVGLSDASCCCVPAILIFVLSICVITDNIGIIILTLFIPGVSAIFNPKNVLICLDLSATSIIAVFKSGHFAASCVHALVLN